MTVIVRFVLTVKYNSRHGDVNEKDGWLILSWSIGCCLKLQGEAPKHLYYIYIYISVHIHLLQ